MPMPINKMRFTSSDYLLTVELRHPEEVSRHIRLYSLFYELKLDFCVADFEQNLVFFSLLIMNSLIDLQQRKMLSMTLSKLQSKLKKHTVNFCLFNDGKCTPLTSRNNSN